MKTIATLLLALAGAGLMTGARGRLETVPTCKAASGCRRAGAQNPVSSDW